MGLQPSDFAGYWVYFGSNVSFDPANPQEAIRACNSVWTAYKFSSDGTWEGILVAGSETLTARTGTWEIANDRLYISSAGAKGNGITVKPISSVEVTIDGKTMVIPINEESPAKATRVTDNEFNNLLELSKTAK